MVRKASKKENIELAEEHIKLAEDLVNEVGRNSEDKKGRYKSAAFALEKAEADLEEENEEEKDEED